MARVYNDNFELSFFDLCELLAAEIEDDACMPSETKEQVFEILGHLEDTLIPYSA